MTNPLLLPELREMLAENDVEGMQEFCTTLHPARAADFAEGLGVQEIWRILDHAEPERRAEIFHYFEPEKQVEIIETIDLDLISPLVADLAPDDRVDILKDVDKAVVDELVPRLPADERRDFVRLRAYPEGTAGAVMTTDFARLSDDMTVSQALDEVRKQAKEKETIYYVFVVDQEDHLQGLVSLRQLVLADSDQQIENVMKRGLVTVSVTDDQEDVARKLARFDFLAIPVVDDEDRLAGIVTHDDVIDVVIEEATEDAHRIGAVEPLREGYLQTSLYTLTWKRLAWLVLFFLGALITALVMREHEPPSVVLVWFMLFVPLVISSGGNSGNQSASLIITALTTGDITRRDWSRVVVRELIMGLLLGGVLALLGFFSSWLIVAEMVPNPAVTALVVGSTILLVVLCGTLTGSILPLVFHRLGWDPALMSNAFVACIIDIVGIVIYLYVASLLLG